MNVVIDNTKEMGLTLDIIDTKYISITFTNY